jgi:O-antigen ligase
MVANALSAVFAHDRYLAVFGEPDRYLGLTYLLDMLILYLAVAVAFRSVTDYAALAGAIAIASVVAMGYAAVQYVGLDPISWRTDVGGRPFSTFGQPDFFGHFLSAAIGLALGVAAGPGRLPPLIRGIAAALVLLYVITSIVVDTRGTLLGAAAAVGALALVYVRVAGLTLRTGALLAAGVAAPVIVLAALVASPIGERATEAWQGAGSGRIRIYGSALAAFFDRPIFGHGLENFSVIYPLYRQPPPSGPGDIQSSAHSWVLHAAATTGVVGLSALLLLVAAFASVLWIRGLRRAPAVAGPVFLALAAYWTHGWLRPVRLQWIGWRGSASAQSQR